MENYMEMIPISAWQSIVNGFDFSQLLSVALGVIPALICITLHELCHGYTAYRLGDMTAKRMGRLTLNPIKHLDIMGLLMMVVFHVGWAKPVPVDMRNFRNPKRDMALTALAGPVSNIIIAVVFLFLYGLLYRILRVSSAAYYLLQLVELTAYMSIGLAVFNLIPVPPLDGSKVLFSVLSNRGYMKLMHYERYGSVIMLLLVATGILGKPLSAVIAFLYDKLFIFAQWGYNAVNYLIK